ncbi:MAG TPA: FecR domain-containing protein, partial [Thermoanaerobaculia bacterium]|nr:FecR domain-containing protein [Thermoanaerobaculia bacterium]
MTHLPIRSNPATAPAPLRALRAFRTTGPLALGMLLALLANAAAAQPPEPASGYETAESQPPAQYGPNSGPNSGPNAGPSAEPGDYDPASAQPPAAADDASSQPVTGSYGYLRLVEGSATVTQASSGSTLAAGVNQPIMVGDRIMVPPRGRVEVVLADRNIVRLDGDTRLQLTRLANSADRQDPSTELRLDEGNLQLIVAQGSIGQELPTVLTPNASTYIQAYGSYRITADRGDFTEVVVRRGTAEVVSDSGDNAVHAGEEAIVDSHRQAGIDVHQAGG